jgi:hypothetical protein
MWRCVVSFVVFHRSEGSHKNLHSLKESCLILVETATSMLCVLQRKLQNQVGELPSDAEANIKAFEKCVFKSHRVIECRAVCTQSPARS